MRLYASYHKTVDPIRLMEIVDRTAAAIKAWTAIPGNEITHLVATGSSGQAVAWPVSYKLGIPVCIVRKPGEDSHAGLISGSGELKGYAIVDDLIASGASVRRVVKALTDDFNAPRSIWEKPQEEPAPECKAIFLYSEENKRGELDGIPTIFTGVPNASE